MRPKSKLLYAVSITVQGLELRPHTLHIWKSQFSMKQFMCPGSFLKINFKLSSFAFQKKLLYFVANIKNTSKLNKKTKTKNKAKHLVFRFGTAILLCYWKLKILFFWERSLQACYLLVILIGPMRTLETWVLWSKFVLQNKSHRVTNTYLKELKHLLQTWRILATESLEATNEKAETIY